MHTHVHTLACTCLRICMHTLVYTCTHTCTHTHTHTHSHTHTHTRDGMSVKHHLEQSAREKGIHIHRRRQYPPTQLRTLLPHPLYASSTNCTPLASTSTRSGGGGGGGGGGRARERGDVGGAWACCAWGAAFGGGRAATCLARVAPGPRGVLSQESEDG